MKIWTRFSVNLKIVFEPAHNKTYNKTFPTNEDSDQPVDLRSLIRIFADCTCLLQPLGYPKKDKWELLPYWMDPMYILIWAFASHTGPEVIQLFSCSTQLSMKFFMLISLKLLTIANSFLLNLADRENFYAYKYENANFCWHFHIYWQRKFYAQLSWAWKKNYNLGARSYCRLSCAGSFGFYCDVSMKFLFVLRFYGQGQPNGIISSAVSSPNYTFTGQA